MPRCIALFSGGLDSMLAVRLMQEQGIEVEAVNFQTAFTCCKDQAGVTAHELGVRLTVLSTDEKYLDLIKKPKFGYGRGANPCVDCRIYMFRRAALALEELDATFIVSGEVVGQRPMSQKRKDLAAISYHSELEDVLLRPLSAKLLPPTKPEREGVVKREKLYGFAGRSRKPLIELGQQLGLKRFPQPSTGCALTEQNFSNKVHDLIRLDPDSGSFDFELLRTGRHIRLNRQVKMVVGRNEQENAVLERMRLRADSTAAAFMRPHNFAGPCCLVLGPIDDEALEFAAGLVLRYAKRFPDDNPQVEVEFPHGQEILSAQPHAAAEAAAPL